MTLAAAAKQLGLHVSTLRKYVQAGMPTDSLGRVGRGHGTQIDLERAKRWMAQRAVPSLDVTKQEDVLQQIATALYDCLKRDDLAACAEISEAQAYMVVLKIYERAYKNVTGEPLTPDTLPPELRDLRVIVLRSMEDGTFSTQRR